jgi:hypothetical protein
VSPGRQRVHGVEDCEVVEVVEAGAADDSDQHWESRLSVDSAKVFGRISTVFRLRRHVRGERGGI